MSFYNQLVYRSTTVIKTHQSTNNIMHEGKLHHDTSIYKQQFAWGPVSSKFFSLEMPFVWGMWQHQSTNISVCKHLFQKTHQPTNIRVCKRQFQKTHQPTNIHVCKRQFKKTHQPTVINVCKCQFQKSEWLWFCYLETVFPIQSPDILIKLGFELHDSPVT